MNPYLKHRLKAVINSVGLYPRAQPQRRTLGQFSRYLAKRNFRPGTVIDVGVADGTLELYGPFPDAELLLVEPMARFKPAIEAILKRRRGHHFLGAAAEQAGEMMLYAAPGSAAAHNAALAPKGSDWKGESLPVERVDRLVETFGLKPPYFLKVDVEGFELDVVAGCTGILEQTPVVVLEAGFTPSNERRPFVEVVTRMSDLGYVVFDLFDGICRPYDQALSISDVAFVRADGEFRQSMRWHAETPTLVNRTLGALREKLGA